MPHVALETHLSVLSPFLDDHTVSDILINQAKEVFVESRGKMKRYMLPQLDRNYLYRLARLIATYNQQSISSEFPTVTGSLPGGARVQIVLPPLVADGAIALAIRKKSITHLNLQDFLHPDDGVTAKIKKAAPQKAGLNLDALEQTLIEAIQSRKNILISGGTGTGKTSFLNLCLSKVPAQERILTLEDSREIQLSHTNRVHLLAHEIQGSRSVAMQKLLKTSLRLRPDRIILGEIRGNEAATFVEAITTGHEGSMSTIHAASPELALSQLAIKATRSGSGHRSVASTIAYLKKIVHIVVQLQRTHDGQRYMTNMLVHESNHS